MKKRFSLLLLALLFITVAATGCKKEPTPSTPKNEITPTPTLSPSPELEESSETTETPAAETVIQISDGEHVITFQLNDSSAAKSLVDQLPLSLEVQDYSNNEKIFYPPEALDTADTPRAGGEIGTLAYYAPWADVVLFFGSYSPNSSLYELGQVVSGSEEIHLLNGTITIEIVPKP